MALDSLQARLWTALPGIVDSFDADRLVCNVQTTILINARDPQGNIQALRIPTLLDCPVVFPSGGGVSLTFPLQVGDEVLVIFASRCIDSWWQLSGVQGQAVMRMHDLSDGFVIPGPRSQPNKYTASTTEVQLRTDDGTTLIGINPTTKAMRLVAPGGIAITSPTLTHNGKNIGDTHVHSGVTIGVNNSGAPV